MKPAGLIAKFKRIEKAFGKAYGGGRAYPLDDGNWVFEIQLAGFVWFEDTESTVLYTEETIEILHEPRVK